MAFNSINYLFFLPIIICLYYLSPEKLKNYLLLAASYLFFAFWDIEMTILLAVLTLINFFFVIDMDREGKKGKRKFYLLFLILLNGSAFILIKSLALLPYVLDYLFVVETPDLLPSTRELVRPVALGFFILQFLSYVFDVYRKDQIAEKKLLIFALYISFFPQLLAGPIERFKNLGSQLTQGHKWHWKNAYKAIQAFLFALFLKFVIADKLAIIIDPAFEYPELYSRGDLWTAIFLYSIQIYADFLAYILMAEGAAHAFGIKLSLNMNFPYFSTGLGDFLSRWHISFYQWFKDYPYQYFLSGSRQGTLGFVPLLLVFGLAAIWHDIRWHYFMWGLYLLFFFLLDGFLDKTLFAKMNRKPWIQGFLIVKTFIIVSLSWVLFRSETMDDAYSLYYSLFDLKINPAAHLEFPIHLWIFLLFFFILEFFRYKNGSDKKLLPWKGWLRWSLLLVFFLAFLFYGSHQQYDFIYIGF